MSENTLVRSAPCPECGEQMLWTQNAWRAADTSNAAYQCLNGHVVDPATTRQCPTCGVHDTTLIDEPAGRQQYRCLRCDATFQVPR
jgi:predicted RNA-binding Zn-ribbon protein involved in translation (DUF1610 family)